MGELVHHRRLVVRPDPALPVGRYEHLALCGECARVELVGLVSDRAAVDGDEAEIHACHSLEGRDGRFRDGLPVRLLSRSRWCREQLLRVVGPDPHGTTGGREVCSSRSV